MKLHSHTTFLKNKHGHFSHLVHVSLTSVRHWKRQLDVCPSLNTSAWRLPFTEHISPSLNTSAWRLSFTEHHTPLVTMILNGRYGVKNKTTTPHRFVLAGSTSHFFLNIYAGSNLKHFVLIRSAHFIYIYDKVWTWSNETLSRKQHVSHFCHRCDLKSKVTKTGSPS